jgi:hypothetical protein
VNKSESIANLAQALCLFQGEVSNPKNSATNPFFKCKYAPLSEVINTTKPILSKHGLSVLQSPSGDGEHIIVTTLLMHSSGEWIEGEPLILKADKITAQGAGSAITYGRRYAMSAILGISSEDDDDGNHATGNKELGKNTEKPKQVAPPSANKSNNDKAQPIKWPAFWAEMSKLGYDEKQVHAFAKVESLKEWNKVMLDELYRDIKSLVNKNKSEEK